MKLIVLAVGRPKGALAEAIESYESRAKRYWKLEALIVTPAARTGTDPRRVMADEGERLIARIPDAGEVVALTRDGRRMGSRDLASYLEQRAVSSTRSVSFVIGGAFGLDGAVLERATRRMSLSDLTLPHDLARLVLTEQLYRAGTILRNEPYHKGTAR